MSDKGSHDFFYSNTYGNTAMQEEIEAARKAALAERQQQEAEIAAAAEP